MKRQILLYFILIIFSLGVSSCADVRSAQGSTAIQVTIQDGAFQPALWKIVAGETIQLNIRNLDSLPHDWTLLARPVTPPFNDTAPLEIIFEHNSAANTHETVSFLSPAAPGEYQVICQQHFNKGETMMGWVISISPSDPADW